MSFLWRRRRRLQRDQIVKEQPNNTEASTETPEEPTAPTLPRVHGGNWMDAVMEQHAKDGGFDNLPGKGKPLNIDLKSDVFDGILKNAGAVPPWIALQQEIRQDIQKAVLLKETELNVDLDSTIAEINTKIRRFNTQCPTPLLQKRSVSAENIAERLSDW
ncbi:DUF1992 domain-containing protein [Alicyclobacillus ferrooxydans]|uniref:DnaJ family domain-containing protein n=1 Tax=Alicyclobacillus ferrooxydans TaxID=471514 RepID=UPI0006D5AF24|nr:DUF1992 domain-containing protein [Alicyclobacillus ferrooxydans]